MAEVSEAPGRLELVRLFENSIELPNGPDQFGGAESAAAWCAANGVTPLEEEAGLERVRAFREALRAVLFAHNGEGEEAAAWQALRPFACSAKLNIFPDRKGCLTLEPAGSGPEGFIAEMLAIVYDSVASGSWRRLRACRKTSCGWAYYDHSKNGTRAWCSMAVCGNREKAQRRRSRERHEHPSPAI